MSLSCSLRALLVLAPLAAACDPEPPLELTLDDDGGTPGVITRALEEGSTGLVEPLGVRNGGTCELSYEASVVTASGGEWLDVNPKFGFIASRTHTKEIELGFDVRDLRPGLYTGSLRLKGTCVATGREAKGSPVTVAINLQITARNATLEPDRKYDEVDVATGWNVVSPTSLDGAPTAKDGHSATWTGDEMIVVGGYGGSTEVHAYDADLDEWRPLAPLPRARYNHTAVWIGEELLVCGGLVANESGVIGASDTCLSYDPKDDAWRTRPSMPEARWRHTAVLAGEGRMIVYGGRDAAGLVLHGFVLDVATGTWSYLTNIGVPWSRQGHVALWTGSEMLVLFGDNGAGTSMTDPHAYHPDSQTWRSLAPPPLAARTNPACAWTGREAVCFGGLDEITGTAFADGASYDPQRDVWTALPAGPLGGRATHSATWTGDEVVFAGGYDFGHVLSDVAAWDPELRTWRSLPDLLSSSAVHTAVLTGNRMIFWGGAGSLVDDVGVLTDRGTVYQADIVPTDPGDPGDGGGDEPGDGGPKLPPQ